MKSEIRWLKISYIAGAVADGLTDPCTGIDFPDGFQLSEGKIS